MYGGIPAPFTAALSPNVDSAPLCTFIRVWKLTFRILTFKTRAIFDGDNYFALRSFGSKRKMNVFFIVRFILRCKLRVSTYLNVGTYLCGQSKIYRYFCYVIYFIN